MNFFRHNLKCWKKLEFYNILHSGQKKKKYSCFRKRGWQEKSSLGRPHFFFFFFLYPFSGAILFFFFSFFYFFCILVFLLACFFFKISNIYSNTHSTVRAGEWQKIFHPALFWKSAGCVSWFGLSVWVGSPDNNFLNISLVSLLSNGRYITILRFFFYIVDTAFVPKISDLCNPRFENSALCKNLNGNTPLLFSSDTSVQYI